MSLVASRTILGTIPMFQSIAVASPSMRLAKKSFKGKRITAKDMMGSAVTTITGVSLMSPTATAIAGF